MEPQRKPSRCNTGQRHSDIECQRADFIANDIRCRVETVHLNIHNLSENRAAELRNHLIGFVFQSFNLINYKNALENVALPLFYQGVSRKTRNALAMEQLERLGLADRATHLPGELSGGQKQRVAIARALVTNPSLILADEPTGALDSHTSKEVMQIFRDLNAEGMTTVIVTHDPNVGAATNRIIRITDGQILPDNV